MAKKDKGEASRIGEVELKNVVLGLLLGYAFDDEPVDVVRIDEGEPLPKRLEEALEDRDALKRILAESSRCAWK